MSTTKLAICVVVVVVLLAGLTRMRSYFEGFKMDTNANNTPSPNTPTNDPPVQYIAPQGQAMMAPQGQAMMAPQGQPMMMAPQGQPMRQGVPLMPPMALPIDAHIMLPIQSPVFARSRANNQQMGAPYQPAQPMLNPGEQVGPTQVMQMPNSN